MLVYLDTSALLKLYVVEAHHTEVHALCAQADLLALSRIARVEACAAFARRGRDAPADQRALVEARRIFFAEWDGYRIVEVAQPVVELACEYAETFALRAYDAVQLASTHELARNLADPVIFACFDRRLNQAAQVLGLEVPFVTVS